MRGDGNVDTVSWIASEREKVKRVSAVSGGKT
jgi:hypothetical protein